MANAAAAQPQLAVKQSKLPVFHADPKKDQFTGDQWLERFENGRIAGAWSAERTKCYFYNSMRDDALSWYRMLKVVKINTDDYEAVRTAFIQNFGDQTNNRVVINDFTHMEQRKDETVQKFFTRIGEIAYNYAVKKPHDEIMGPLWAIPEEHEETLAAYAALPIATRRLIQRLNYEQTQKNDVSYLGLQFFIAGLRQDISMEVVKSGTNGYVPGIPHCSSL